MRHLQLPIRSIKRIHNKLDLGCGPEVKKDFIGMDFVDFGQDIVWDITDGIPLPDNSVDEIYSSHFVEHIAEIDIDEMIKEMMRVCKIGSVIHIKCPHADTIEAYFLSHLSLWHENRIKAICQGVKGWNWDKKLKAFDIKIHGIEIDFKLEVCS